MKINKHILQYYFLTLLGFVLLIYYLWFRFIRERLPRNIPLALTIFSFFFISMICGIYLYTIYRYFKPKQLNPVILKWLSILLKIYIPFYTLDTYIKNQKYIFNIFDFLCKSLSSYCYTKNFYACKNSFKFYIVHTTLLKIIVLIVFILDIFYFHKFYLIYSGICLGLIPIIKNYIIFTMKQIREKDIQYMKYHYNIQLIDDPDLYFFSGSALKKDDDGYTDINHFIFLQFFSIQFEYPLYKYACIETWEARVSYAKEHNLFLEKTYDYTPASDEISIGLSKKFYELMPQIIYLHAFVETDYDMSIDPRVRRINIIITSIYLLCWIYILFVSIHTLQDMSTILKLLEILTDYSVIKEPFSTTQLDLEKIYNKE